MPIALDPQKEFPVVLETDKLKPADERPTFMVKALTIEEAETLSNEFDEAFAPDTYREIMDSHVKLFYKYVKSWKNMGSFEYGCNIKQFLLFKELKEVLSKVMANNHVSAEEKKG